jgi:hypothetical protein
MKKDKVYFGLTLVFLVLLVICAGCESMGVTVTYDDTPTKLTTLTTPNLTPTPTQRPIITAPRPTPIKTVNITEVPTGEPTIEVTWTPRPKEEIPDIADPNNPYLTYKDDDFSIQYPSNWTAAKSSMNSPKTPYIRDGLLKGDTRLVKFESKSGKTNFTVQTTDYLVPGYTPMDILIESAYRSVMYRFNDVSGYSAVTNYELKYTPQYQTPYVTFDVTLPKTSSSYPYSYTERDLGSYTHFYTFRFNTMGDLGNYTELKRVMFESVKTEEKVKVS